MERDKEGRHTLLIAFFDVRQQPIHLLINSNKLTNQFRRPPASFFFFFWFSIGNHKEQFDHVLSFNALEKVWYQLS